MNLVFIIGIAIAILIFFVSRRPDTFAYTRSVVINATPEAVYKEVEDFRRWAFWSPWAAIDPNCKHTFEGAQTGAGAIYSWEGNSKVGAGKMTITEAKPAEVILIDLEFYKPMKALNHTEFTFTPHGGGTQVTWTMRGQNTLFSKLIDLIMNCEKMVGGMFVTGLTNLKKVAESKA